MPEPNSLRIFNGVQYMGSFPVASPDIASRADSVRSQLESLRYSDRSTAVLLIVSLTGIKVCSPDGKCVQMAHALRRISYATCEPQHAQFSFLAREPRAHFTIQYCHSFITESPEQGAAFLEHTPELVRRCKDLSGVKNVSIEYNSEKQSSSRSSACFLVCLDENPTNAVLQWNEDGSMNLDASIEVIRQVASDTMNEILSEDTEEFEDFIEFLIRGPKSCSETMAIGYCGKVIETLTCLARYNHPEISHPYAEE